MFIFHFTEERMAKQTLKQYAYTSIKDKILTCEYRPNSFLNEDLLCEELKISRTPVRDALSRLEHERLVTILPKKGFLVAPVTSDDINMVFEGRLLLETYIIENYCSNIPTEVIDRMKLLSEQYSNAIKNDEEHLYYDLDNAFHMCFISQCPNHYFLQTYEMFQDHDRRLRVLTGTSLSKRLLSTISEHKTILSYLETGDTKRASKALQTHLTNSKISSFNVI